MQREDVLGGAAKPRLNMAPFDTPGMTRARPAMTHAGSCPACSREVSLGFVPRRMPEGTHIAHLFADDEERKRVAGAYLTSGLQDGEWVEYFADVDTDAALPAVLADLGVGADWPPPATLVPSRALDVYCPTGCFGAQPMLARYSQFITKSGERGCSGARVIGQMSWALRGLPGSDELTVYEAGINGVVAQWPVTVLCQYDLRRFDGAQIFDMLSVHPMVVVRGLLMANPLYRPDWALAPQETVQEAIG